MPNFWQRQLVTIHAAVTMVGFDEIVKHSRRFSIEIRTLNKSARDEGREAHGLTLSPKLIALREPIQFIVNCAACHNVQLRFHQTILISPFFLMLR